MSDNQRFLIVLAIEPCAASDHVDRLVPTAGRARHSLHRGTSDLHVGVHSPLALGSASWSAFCRQCSAQGGLGVRNAASRNVKSAPVHACTGTHFLGHLGDVTFPSKYAPAVRSA